MSDFVQDLERRLGAIREQGLYRRLRPVDGPQGPRLRSHGLDLVNFSSNDYLGLANHPALKEAALAAVERYGAGSGASRLICGSLAPHHELEETVAAFKQTEAALAFSSGYAAAIGTICAVIDKQDLVVIDKRVHASLVDAARLCGAKLRVFAHNDLDDLERILRWADRRPAAVAAGSRPRILVVTESIFSMEGDHAPLSHLVELKDRFGAWLMVDEAHATGLFGTHRSGLIEERGLADRVEIQMTTLGKALGAAGGCICGSRVLIDYLVNRARPFIFSTAPAPVAAAAATAGIRLVQSDAGADLVSRLWEVQGKVSAVLSGWSRQPASHRSPILPILVGSESGAVRLADDLRAQGLLIPAIRYPTVARGSARLRLTVTAAHCQADIARLTAALEPLLTAHPASLHA